MKKRQRIQSWRNINVVILPKTAKSSKMIQDFYKLNIFTAMLIQNNLNIIWLLMYNYKNTQPSWANKKQTINLFFFHFDGVCQHLYLHPFIVQVRSELFHFSCHSSRSILPVISRVRWCVSATPIRTGIQPGQPWINFPKEKNKFIKNFLKILYVNHCNAMVCWHYSVCL